MKVMQGGCYCGAVRYEVSAEPLMVRMCWCKVCQKLAAGSPTVNMVVPKAAVKVTGKLQDHAALADSGNHMHRYFCPVCGVHVMGAADERPAFLVLRVGTLDDPSQVTPQVNIWTASAPAWAKIDSSLQSFPGQPPPPSLPVK
ncbi:MAG TPA: GFA family protein [Candidatus Acidoferrum sp.]|nr:GFA family protein [Candidatus Acidoferrum sp.]